MNYIRDLLHDIRMAVQHFLYIRTHLRRGGNPDEAAF
jgi:hypothetical protein